MKKITLLQAIAVLALPVIFYFVISGFKNSKPEINTTSNIITVQNPPQSIPKDFTNFILNESYGHTNTLCGDGETNWQLENHLTEYRSELGYNGVQMYDFHLGSDCMGLFANSMSPDQIGKVQSLIDGAHSNQLKAIYQRSNLSMLCTSQRLIYEVTQPPGSQNTNYGFCYNSTAGKFETEPDGTTAIHACMNPASCNIEEDFDAVPQYICSGIYENMQHTDLPFFQAPGERGTWHLKPRMKIRQQDFSPTDDRPVVTIEVIPFGGGAPIASKVIRINHFRNESGNYSGEYREMYTFDQNIDSLWILGSTNGGLSQGWLENLDPETECHVDFRIKWEGNVDVWFDKLTVDDARANELFKGNYDPFINAELLNFGGVGSNKMDMFFCDEVVHSQIPACIYVQEYLRNSSYPGTRITFAVTNQLNVIGMKNDDWGFRLMHTRSPRDMSLPISSHLATRIVIFRHHGMSAPQHTTQEYRMYHLVINIQFHPRNLMVHLFTRYIMQN